jgi:PAS domain S-box-containing protein
MQSNSKPSKTELVKRNEVLTATVDELRQEVARREKAEQALSQERQILHTLIDNLPDGIYAKDLNGRKIMANPADVKNCSCDSVSQVIGKTDFDLFPKDLAEHFAADDEAVFKGEPVLWREEYVPGKDGEKHWMLTTKLPLRAADGSVIGLVGIGRDVTPLKEAEKKLETIHKDLVRASRVAGMAEIATSVLHNVGNVLNGINVSTSMILDRLTKMKIGRVAELAKVLDEHQDDLPQFIANDPRGQQVAGFLKLLAENLEQERAGLRAELDQLALKIDHIKQIVSMQQNYSKVAGVVEKTDLVDIVEDAIHIHSSAYQRHCVVVEKQYEARPTIFVDRHKILQILGNLLSNAKYACDGSSNKDKKVIVRVETLPGNFVRMRVTDNGMGITKENLGRIFTQGFTTRYGGHGFGLHGSALSTREIGGTLTVASDGPGSGATFTLEIPADDPKAVDSHA